MRAVIALILTAILLIGLAVTAGAQQWSGVLDPARATDWSNAGIPGGIPVRSLICATLNPGATAAQISAAIATCPTGQVVFLNAGTYNLSTGIDFNNHSNVTLRGAGPDQTKLIFSGSFNCSGLGTDVCVRNGDNSFAGGPSNTVNWTAGYAAGTTQITLSSTPNLIAGKSIIVLDQLDDSNTDTGNIWICESLITVCTTEGSASGGQRPGRAQLQVVRVTAIAGNVVTIDPALRMPNWSSGKSPQAWYANTIITGVGVENLSMDHTNNGGNSGLLVFNGYANWVKNVRSITPNRSHVWDFISQRTVVRDSYFYGTQNAASQSYGAESYVDGEMLVENNIFQHIAAPVSVNGGGSGNVYSYNYSLDDFNGVGQNVMFFAHWLHSAGIALMLFEGNIGAGFAGDNIHGTHHFVTVFRNYYNGWETGKTNQTNPIYLAAFSRYLNIIGNVLGRSGYHTTYQDLAPSGMSVGFPSSTTIDAIGWGNATTGSNNDTLVATTLMRWGNYDTVNNAVRFVSGEVPSGLSPYGNGVPVSQTLPPSFYLSSVPSFWGTPSGTPPWPAIGPDVTGGNVANVAGHANKIPSQLCFEAATNDPSYPVDPSGGRVKVFTPSTCYMAVAPPSTACTPGQNCYCDCVNGPATIGSFKNAACQTKNVPVDPNKMLCEDWEAPTLHGTNTGAVGAGAPYFGPWYDDTGFSTARGNNSYWRQKYGSSTCECAWGPNQPPNPPTLGATCGGGFQCCFEGVWFQGDPFQSNSFACMNILQNGEFAQEVATITPPTNASGGGSGVFDGNQSLGFRNGIGRTAGPGSVGSFGGAHKDFGVTMAMAYPANTVSSGIWNAPWKHNEYHPVQRPCNVGDPILAIHVLGTGPTASDPFHNVIFPADDGTNHCTSIVTQAQCNSSISGATVRKGQLSCDNAANFRFQADTSYLQSRDWPFGTWGCIKGEFHFGGGPGVGASVKITLTTPNVTDMVLIDFDHFDDSILDSKLGYDGVAWNNFANTNQGGGATPTVTAAYRYEDNIHITAGTPVSCAQIGYPSSVSPALQLQGGALQLCGSALCLK